MNGPDVPAVFSDSVSLMKTVVENTTANASKSDKGPLPSTVKNISTD